MGFDFAYDYLSGFAAVLGLAGDPWRAVWETLDGAVVDNDANKSNRFEAAADLNRRIGDGPGPFWSCGTKTVPAGLTRTREGLFGFPFQSRAVTVNRLRITDTALSGVQDVWKLFGAGSVGSQALVGIPAVHRLRNDPALAGVSAVWPFETGLTDRPVPEHGPCVLHAEIWPGIIDAAVLDQEKENADPIHDAAQVRLMCRWARDLDAEGTLGTWFNPSELTAEERRVVTDEEGWILGAQGAAR